MEVQTVADADRSTRKAIRYAGVALLTVACFTLPALVSTTYATALRTVLLVLLLGLVGRTYLGALLSFRPTEPPVPLPDSPPSVSVVVPAYNEEPVLQGTIDAALALDYPGDVEVVVCYEAASSDRTAEIAERAASEHPEVVAVERDEPGGGKAKATNYALQYATGEIIASIDADHQFEPGAVTRAVRWFAADEDIWCVKGRCYGRNPTDSLLALHATVERHIAELSDLYGRQAFGGFTIFGGGQAFFRAELFEELGAFDEEILVEDIDMSARIHAAGKRLRVDPEVITYEENPATLEAWWSQRTRWARGWMQVAVRHLPSLPRVGHLSTRTKSDVVFTFTYALVPVVLILTFPMLLLDHTVLSGGTYLPYDRALWAAVGLGPLVSSLLVFARDAVYGHRHHPAELLAAVTLWGYFFAQSVVYVVAFLEEFVFDEASVYVTTSRSGSERETPADD